MSEYDIFFEIGAYDEDDNIKGIEEDYITIFEIYDMSRELLFSDKNIYSGGGGYYNKEDSRVLKYDVSNYFPPTDEYVIVRATVRPTESYTFFTFEESMDEEDFDELGRYFIDGYVSREMSYSLSTYDKSRLGKGNFSYAIESDKYSNIPFTKNINMKIVPHNDYFEEVECMFVTSNNFSFSRELMNIKNTEMVTHTRSEADVIEIEMKLSDVWKDGELVTHRDKELDKLNALYYNDEMVKIVSNISNIIYDDSDSDSLNISKDFVISSLNVTEDNSSKNTYECKLELKKVNFVESKVYNEYPSSISSEDLYKNEDTGVFIDLERRKEEEEEELHKLENKEYTDCPIDDVDDVVKKIPFEEDTDLPQKHTFSVKDEVFKIKYEKAEKSFGLLTTIKDVEGNRLYHGILRDCTDGTANLREGKIITPLFDFRVFKFDGTAVTDIRITKVYDYL